MYEKRKAVRTGRAAARPARVALTHAAGVLLAIVAVFSLFPAKGLALPGSEKNAYPLGEILMSENVGANRGTVVYGAANEFFATLCLIGRKSDYLQLSTDQLAELSNEGSGGAFWELSQRWSNYGSDGPPENWPIGISLAMEGQGLISDPAYIWYADYSYFESDSLYQRALADYLTIYNGGHLGGGGGSSTSFSPVNNYVYYNNTSHTNPAFIYESSTNNKYYLGGNKSLYAPQPFTVAISDYTISGLPDGDYSFFYQVSFPTQGKCSFQIYAFTNDSPTITYRTDGKGNSRINRVTDLGTVYYSNLNNNQFSYTFDGSTVSVGNVGTITFSRSGSSSILQPSVYSYQDSVSGPSGGPNNWPDPPSNPVVNPPEVPGPQEPTGPGIDPPDPIGYTIDPTDDPDPVTDPYVVVVAPDSQDIIPWLRAILQAINNLGDKLNDESTELQRALNQVFFTNLSKLLKNLKGEFLQDFTQWLDLELEWMMESIESLFLDLQDYLHDLFEWLADQMNFEFDISTDPYDDTSLLNWLRRIYNKLGSDGGPNTQPVDPSTDPEGFLDWLSRMIAEFILGLGASASDLVSDIGDLLSRLFAKFPFSVPWDILAILGMLDAPPVAPHIQFSIPVPLGADSFNWSVDIDMQVWSTYVEAVRTVILLSFITWLAWLTPQVLRDLDPGDFL